MITDYKIIRSPLTDKSICAFKVVELEVQQFLAAGWQPVGEAREICGFLCQTLVIQEKDQ